jgi:oxygen-independent coproporphyrinogen-3 oxidase
MLSLYIHIPYCVRKCLYCGFYSTVYDRRKADAFIDALRLDVFRVKTEFANRTVSNVYVGGGTPTALSCDQIERIGHIISDNFTLAGNAEFTVEANPQSALREVLDALLQQGANRVSLGIQSFSDDILQTLGRPHSAGQAETAYRTARDAGFRNIGFDLMYGIPGQTWSQWEKTLDSAIARGPEHLSLYALSLDDGSAFTRAAKAGSLTLPDDEMTSGQYERAVELITRAGYRRYEISNFARPGYECRHNMNYWERGEYAGVGPGAWSFLGGRRFGNIADTEEYVRRLKSGGSPVAESEVLSHEQSAREMIMLNLRTAQGLDLLRYAELFGERFSEQLETRGAPLAAEGLVSVVGERLVLTERGILVSNEVLAKLSP